MKNFLFVVTHFFASMACYGNSMGVSGSVTSQTGSDSLIAAHHFIDLKIKELEKLSGRKFTFKEKIKLKALKILLKKNYKEADPDKQATFSFLFALLAIGLLIPGLLNVLTGAAFLGIIPVLAILALWLGLRSKRSGKNFKNMFGIIVGGSIILLGLIIGIGASSL